MASLLRWPDLLVSSFSLLPIVIGYGWVAASWLSVSIFYKLPVNRTFLSEIIFKKKKVFCSLFGGLIEPLVFVSPIALYLLGICFLNNETTIVNFFELSIEYSLYFTISVILKILEFLNCTAMLCHIGHGMVMKVWGFVMFSTCWIVELDMLKFLWCGFSVLFFPC